MSTPFATAQASYDRIISALRSRGSRHGTDQADTSMWQCPAHDDRNPSLSVTYRPHEARTFVNCFAGCEDQAVLDALGLKVADLFDEPAVPKTARGRRRTELNRTALTVAKTPTTARPRKPVCTGPFREVATYSYRDETAVLVGEKIRKECQGCEVCADGKPGKKFIWRHQQDGEGPWIWKMPVTLPMYRAERLAAAPAASTVYLVEGEKSVHVLESQQLVATTAPGSGSTRWDPDHTPLFSGMHLVIVADRDETGYKKAFETRDALLEVAASVRVVRAAVDEPKADVVEHLRAGFGVEQLEMVPEPEPDNVVALPVASAKDALSGDEPARPGGGGGGGGGDLDDAVPNRMPEYLLRHGELVKVNRRKVGDQEEINYDVLLGCSARIVRVEQDEAGGNDESGRARAPQTSGYVVELAHPERPDEPVQVQVPLDEYANGSWLANLPWPDIYYQNTRNALSDLAAAIRVVSRGTAVTVPVYTATGWRQISPGRWMYVHADGGITADGHVEVRTRFPGRLRLLAWPEPSADPQEIRKAAECSLSMPAILPGRIAAPLLGLVYRAVFGRCPSTLTLGGNPGSGKTSLGVLGARHFAPALHRNAALLSLSKQGSTALGISTLQYLVMDSLLMGDDSAPDASVKDAAVAISTLARRQYNGDGRWKVNPKTDTVMEPKSPRGSLLLTAEVQAAAQSGQERMLTIPLAKGDVDIKELVRLSSPEIAAGCAMLMSCFTKWIAADFPAMRDRVEQLAGQYANELRTLVGDRPAEHLGHFAAGWAMMLQFLLESGTYSSADTDVWWNEVWKSLISAGQAQEELLEEGKDHIRLLNYLASAFSGGMAHLTGPDGGCPEGEDALTYGWAPSDNGGVDELGQRRPPLLRANGPSLGVVTTMEVDGRKQKRLWLYHEVATRTALKMAGDLGEPFNTTPTILTSSLRANNVIIAERDGTRWVKPRRQMPGQRTRVWDMSPDALWGNDLAGGPAPEDDGPQVTPPTPPRPRTPAERTANLALSSAATTPTIAPGAGHVPAQAPRGEQAPTPAPVVTGAPVTTAPRPAAPQPVQPQNQAEPVPAPEPARTPAQVSAPVAPAPAAAQPQAVGQRSHPKAAKPTTRPWRAAAAVADVDGVYLPDGEVVPLPANLSHAGQLADLVLSLDLGHGGKERGQGASAKWWPEPGQIYLTPALCARLDLPEPEDAPHEERQQFLTEHADHPFLEGARASGWAVNGWGNPTRLWRDDANQVRAQLILVPVARLDGAPFLEDDVPPTRLAQRVQELADLIGIPFRRTPGATGSDLLKRTRPDGEGGRAEGLHVVPMPKVIRDNRNLYVAQYWHRMPNSEELKRRYLLGFDARASYLSVCGSLRVPRLGEAEHLKNPEFDPTTFGFYRVVMPKWTTWGCFDPFNTRLGNRPDGEARWYASPTLDMAQKELGIEVRPVEGLVWSDTYRMLELWYKQLSASRKLLTGTDPTVDATFKATYTGAIGRLNSELLRTDREGKPNKLYRTDVHLAILAAQQANLARTILRIGEQHQMWPVAVRNDCLYYATDATDWATAVPGLRMEEALGNFKPESAALLTDALPYLRQPLFKPPRGVFTPAKEWMWP